MAASLATALVVGERLPPKLNPVIRSIMNGVKVEGHALLQARHADAAAALIELCLPRMPGPLRGMCVCVWGGGLPS